MDNTDRKAQIRVIVAIEHGVEASKLGNKIRSARSLYGMKEYGIQELPSLEVIETTETSETMAMITESIGKNFPLIVLFQINKGLNPGVELPQNEMSRIVKEYPLGVSVDLSLPARLPEAIVQLAKIEIPHIDFALSTAIFVLSEKQAEHKD